MVNMALHIFDHFHLLTSLQEFVVKVQSLDMDGKDWNNTVLNFINKNFYHLDYLPAGQQDKSFW